MLVLVVFASHWYLSLFTQTFFHHRYASHRMFTMSKAWERVFYVMSWIFQGSSYLSPRAYGIMHRMHHAYADTENDPHSPQYDSNFFTMMWRTRKIYNSIYTRVAKIEPRFLKELPDWKKFDIFASSNITRTAWVLVYLGIYLAFSPPWWLYPLVAIHAVMGPFHGVIINWFAHEIGYRNFKVKDTSKNLMPVDILMLGEGLHNNHHKHAGRANFGWKKWEFDPVYPVIWTLAKLGVIKLRAVPATVPAATTVPMEVEAEA